MNPNELEKRLESPFRKRVERLRYTAIGWMDLMNVNQQDLANYIGVHRNLISKALSKPNYTEDDIEVAWKEIKLTIIINSLNRLLAERIDELNNPEKVYQRGFTLDILRSKKG